LYSLYEKYSTYWYRLDPAAGPSREIGAKSSR
jgi:hypothetical protein